MTSRLWRRSRTTYDQAAPALLAMLRNFTVTGNTITSKSQAVQRAAQETHRHGADHAAVPARRTSRASSRSTSSTRTRSPCWPSTRPSTTAFSRALPTCCRKIKATQGHQAHRGRPGRVPQPEAGVRLPAGLSGVHRHPRPELLRPAQPAAHAADDPVRRRHPGRPALRQPQRPDRRTRRCPTSLDDDQCRRTLTAPARPRR